MPSRAKIDSKTFLNRIGDYALEKTISIDEAIRVFELALQETLVSLKYAIRNPIVKIDEKIGKISLFESFLVDDEEESEDTISLKKAKESDPNIKIGERLLIEQEMPAINRGVLAKLTQALKKNTNIVKNQKQYDFYKDKVGELVTVFSKEIDFGNAIIEMKEGRAILLREDMVSGEVPPRVISQSVENNTIDKKRFKAVISKVVRRDVGWQVFLSRASNEFLYELMKAEIPEIESGMIEIKGIARIPGEKAKVLVYSTESGIDPIGACIGIAGMRINAITKECNGERIDVVSWSDDINELIKNLFYPVNVEKLVIYDDGNIELVVPDEQLKIAIGSKGYNVRLASELLGQKVDLSSSTDYATKKSEYINNRSKILQEALETDGFMSKFLILEGFESFYDILNSDTESLATLEGFDEEIALELKNRAREYVDKSLSSYDIDEEIFDIKNIDRSVVLELAQSGITRLEQIGDLSRDEVFDLLVYSKPSNEEVDEMILNARQKLGWIKNSE